MFMSFVLWFPRLHFFTFDEIEIPTKFILISSKFRRNFDVSFSRNFDVSISQNFNLDVEIGIWLRRQSFTFEEIKISTKSHPNFLEIWMFRFTDSSILISKRKCFISTSEFRVRNRNFALETFSIFHQNK
jgi:hypothetical protein